MSRSSAGRCGRACGDGQQQRLIFFDGAGRSVTYMMVVLPVIQAELPVDSPSGGRWLGSGTNGKRAMLRRMGQEGPGATPWLGGRLGQQLQFLLETDRLKQIVRQTMVSDGSRP